MTTERLMLGRRADRADRVDHVAGRVEGRRVEWPEVPAPRQAIPEGPHVPEWPPEGLLAPGDYTKHPNGTWYAMTPHGHLANLTNHDVVEHEDGTITVIPSLEELDERIQPPILP